jgi:transposase
MMRGPAAVRIELTEGERAELERLCRRTSIGQAIALRARIVLRAADGGSNVEISERLGVNRQTVLKWRRRFHRERLDGLYDEPRPGAPRKVSDEKIERLIEKTLQTKPKGATHWSTRTMARSIGMTQSTVSRVWRAFGLQPHRADTFTISNDPLFVEKVRDVVGLYMNPPENAVVLCVDEKSQIQALDRTQPLLPMLPGTPGRHTPTYSRHGTTSLFAALDMKTGCVIGECRHRHTAQDFLAFLRSIDAAVPPHLEVHAIMDNLATHKTPAVKRWFARHPRFHPHFIPTHSSWLNMVERFFGILEARQIKRGNHRSVASLKAAIAEFLDATNADPKPFIWTKSADQILENLARYCQRVSDSGH